MNLKTMTSAAVLTLLAFTGCGRGESPEETQADVAEAQAEGNEQLAEARQDAAEDMQQAQENVHEEQQAAAGDTAVARYDVAVAKAEAEHKVAVEKCEAVMGDQRAACKDSADQALEQSKQQARAEREAAKP